MGQAHELQLSRLENKYLVTPELALAIREFVGSFLEIDEFGATQRDFSYPVHSLYLDSDDLTIYWGTINGNKNRYKLRLRFYENRPNAPVFFEIKRRMNNAILKQRGAVRRDAVEAVLAGHLPAPDQMASDDPKHFKAVQNFHRLMLDTAATPRAHVAYRREAWVQPDDNSVRVTLDRDVFIEPDRTSLLNTDLARPFEVFPGWVVLELKFTGRYPEWFKHLVQTFNLQQGCAAKYADGVALVGEARFTDRVVPPPGPEGSRKRAERMRNLRRMHRRSAELFDSTP